MGEKSIYYTFVDGVTLQKVWNKMFQSSAWTGAFIFAPSADKSINALVLHGGNTLHSTLRSRVISNNLI